jgi:hypothetical protein
MRVRTHENANHKKLRNVDKVGVYVKISEELYNLLKDFCDETGNEINRYVENCVLESINSSMNGEKAKDAALKNNQ